MYEIWTEILANRILVVAFLGWFIAQFIKMVLYLIINKEFRLERMVGAGGMPSSHAATVCALTTGSYLQYGINSFQFAISLVLTAIVIHDARGVRLETGKQATILNILTEHFPHDANVSMPKLKELVGHTPLQVVIGSVLGILIAIVFF